MVYMIMISPTRELLDDDATKKLREVYSYEWTNTTL